MTKFGVVVFPGSNCDRDVAYVTRDVLQQPTRMVWHQETDITDIDVMILPGGFSYGDYLRCGAIARFSPVMRSVVEHAQKGKFVLGICNGFQVLTESGLLPGILTRNRDLHFICEATPLKVERNNLPWTQGYQLGEIINVPIAHGEGRFYADKATLREIEDSGQVLFRYAGNNPNGSVNNIAGICNSTGNVLGMMPHPERASDAMLGGTDGLRLFQGLLEKVVALV
ncbi:MAG: phosphoribosylformylglycinamidine synthase subunit PurQ [Nostocaceae cyanobacterium]|nr:phosphoribosylformylglycinamidine synthase subunit PurQ [Nostocaceae cyanobacterium]